MALAAALSLVLPAQNALAWTFTDVPSTYWDHIAIGHVAISHTWMQDYGQQYFHPTSNELRKYLARTLVTIYAPNEPPDRNIKIKDVPPTDPFWPYINVAVKLTWMPLYKSGVFAPNGAIRVAGFDRAAVLALGLSSQMAALGNVHMANGTKYQLFTDFPYLTLAHVLQLHFNHSDESMDIERNQLITRDEAAYSVDWMTDGMSWQIAHAKSWYNKIELPNLDPNDPTQAAQIAVTTYALSQAGFPYIYAGEWNTKSPAGYCCGYQPKGGFDCSGLAWWVEKMYENGYNAAQFRTYKGWSLPQRSSSQMAEYTKNPISFGNLQPGDLMFFASNGGKGWQDVDHVAIYLGNSWFVHSSSSNDGVLLDWIGSGSTYYQDTFVFGRRLIGGSGAPARGPDAFQVTKQTLLEGDAR